MAIDGIVDFVLKVSYGLIALACMRPELDSDIRPNCELHLHEKYRAIS